MTTEQLREAAGASGLKKAGGPPAAVLLVEDNPGDARLIEELLVDAGRPFELTVADTLAAGLAELASGRPVMAVLLDLTLPDSEGAGTFTSLRAAAPHVPVILLTGLDDGQLALELVAAGAQDYLVKGQVDGPLLARAIRYAIERHRADDALVRSEEKLRLAMEASESGIWDLDVRTMQITASADCQAMLGYEAVEVSGDLEEFWAGAIHPDEREASMAALMDVIEGRSPVYEREHRLHARDDGWVWVHGKGRVVERSEDGEPLRLIITRTNITQRKQAEAAAAENERLAIEQRRITDLLQEGLVHALPPVAGLDLGRVSQSAYEPALVGGDFSGVFVIDEAHVAVLIGDVEGKGVAAAGLAETVSSAVHAFSLIDRSPAFMLRKTNELLLRRNHRFLQAVTAFLVVLHLPSGDLTYACAGHPAPVRIDPAEAVLLDAEPGLPLGAFPGDYLDSHGTLKAGECLVLYTDGVTEAHGDADLFGDERLLETLASLDGEPAQAVAQRLLAAAVAHAGQLRDDVEILAVRLAR